MGADLLGGLQREAAAECREPAEKLALAVPEQLVAPLKRRLQGLMTQGRGGVTAAKDGNPSLEPVGDLLDAENRRACSRQFDCQRHPVEGLTDPLDRFGHPRGSGIEAAGGAPDALGEQFSRSRRQAGATPARRGRGAAGGW
jgi:hypothetical protein